MPLRYDGPPYAYTTWIPAGTRALRQAIDERWPSVRTEVVRMKARCDESPSEHCECRAIDGYSSERPVRREIFDTLVTEADELGVQSVIADRRVWGFGRWAERHYDGPHPHDDHTHIGITRAAADTLTLTHCRRVLGVAGPTPGGPMDFTLAQVADAVWERRVMNNAEGKVYPAANILSWAHQDARDAMNLARDLRAVVEQLRDEIAELRDRMPPA